MNDAWKRWLRTVALSLTLTAPAWAQGVLFPGGPPQDPFVESDEGTATVVDDSGSVSIADDAASIHLGGNSYGTTTVSAPPPPVTPPPSPYEISPGQVLGAAPPVFHDAMVPDDLGVGFARTSDLDQILWRVGGVTMDQYGIQGGYTNINAFIPISIESDSALWWLNPRVNVTDYGAGATSVGFGRSSYVAEEDRVYRASFWWDYDPGHQGTYNRLGGSFESIGQYFSLRGNFALPIGSTLTNYGVTTQDPIFVGNQVVVPLVFQSERAYSEYDLEMTIPFPVFGRYGVDLGLGGYYLGAEKSPDAVGVSVRTQAQITEDFWINGLYTNDRLFNSQFSINFELTMPDGVPAHWFRRKPVSDSLTASVQRRYRVPVRRFTGSGSTVLTDANGDPLTIAFIDPNKTTAGDGSRANPFMSIADYMSVVPDERALFDLIFVNRRTDPTEDTNLNTTIVLLDFQALIGNGTLPDGSRPTINGFVNGNEVTVPLPVDPGALPRLTNSAATTLDVVTLANGNTVAGFNIDASGTANGIQGDGIGGLGIQGFNINNNMFSNVVDGINITSNTALPSAAQPNGVIDNNTLTGDGFNSNRGVAITHIDGTLNLLVTNNSVSGFLGEDANGNGVLNTGEDNNGNGGTPDPGIGMQIIAAGGEINATDPTNTGTWGLLNNAVAGNGTGVQLEAIGTGVFTVDLIGNDEAITVNGTAFQGISGNVDEDSAGFVALARDGGSLTLQTITGNVFDNNQGDGVLLIARDGGSLTVPQFEDVNGNGQLDPDGDVNGNGLLDPGDTDSNGDGIPDPDEDQNGNGLLDIGLVGNSMSGNRDNGVEILADNATLTAYIGAIGAGNTINNNGRVDSLGSSNTVVGSGILLTTLDFGQVFGAIDGNTISGNAEAGIKIAPDEGGTVDLESISGNTITNNGRTQGGGDAIVFAPSNGATFSVSDFSDNTFTGNLGATIRIGGNGGIVDLGVIEGQVFDRTTTGTAGILFDAENSIITGIIRNNEFIASTNNANATFGIGGEVRGGTLDLVIDGNRFVNNADAGIGFILTESDDRVPPATGTPLTGDAVDASMIIANNTIIGTRVGNNSNFDGSGIDIILAGQEHDPLEGVPVPPGAGPDETTEIQPAARLESLISGNIIGVDPLRTGVDLNDPTTWNVEDGNAGSGISIQLSGDTAITDLTGSPIDNLDLDGMLIENNLVGNNVLDGIRFRRHDSAIIDNVDINANIIRNNGEDGIDIQGINNGLQYGIPDVLDFDITGNNLLNNGFLTDGTQGNAGRGIQLRADVAAVLGVNISQNLIDSNRLSGIEARTFTETHNVARVDDSASLGDGADGVIFGEWRENVITANGFLPRDEGAPVDGTLAGHGIALGRIDMIDPDNVDVNGDSVRRVEGFNNGGFLMDTDDDGIGDEPALLSILENNVSGNALDGIHVFLDKSVFVFSNEIGDFRASRIDINDNNINDNGDDGLNIHSPDGALAIVDFNRNVVMRNGVFSGQRSVLQAGDNTVNIVGDGIEIVTGLQGQLQITARNNRIKENNGRGVNIFNGGKPAAIPGGSEGYLRATFENNNISSNAREGFYVVNAPLTVQYIPLYLGAIPETGATNTGYAANSWLADFDSNHEMFNYGRVTGLEAGNTPPAVVDPFLDRTNQTPAGIFTSAPITDLTFTNNIVDNNGSIQPDADPADSAPYSTVGGFVLRVGSATEDPTATTPFSESTIQAFFDGNLTTPLIGGVRANVQNNRMSGNYGRDVLIDGFIATLPPNVSTFNDPLIRIDLIFENNRGTSISVDFDAFYENTQPTTLGGTNVVRPNPPFNDPTIPRSATYNNGLFPGDLLGTRTLRIEFSGASPNANGISIGNNLFNNIYSDFGTWQIVPDGFFGVPFPPQ